MLVTAAILFVGVTSCSKYKYESVAGDPLQTRIYTLDNGLKVYMTVNKETPRIQTYIAVKVGAKNDPIETTGLAHYFEHLMFKGTQQFGTQDYEAEKPYLDRIEALFEVYRNTTDPEERKAIYAEIDSVSNLASQLAIPNEYDKLMAAIGASGTNAFTSYDMTVYQDEIPANQVENWVKIQADRFANPVIRGFHTELETVYEEFNMSLTDDSRKMYQALLEALAPRHPYGMHTVLGTQEHLKNPSITNIKNYHKTFYVPNNMAICLSGDFDPDRMIALIDTYFGGMQPNKELPEFTFEPEPEVTAPVVKEVSGQEAERLYLAWRTGGATSDDADMIRLVSPLLANGKCGLLDVDIQQQQKALAVGASDIQLADYGGLVVIGYPKQGQTLEEVRDLLLEEIEKLRRGDFDESMLAATINNYRRSEMQNQDSNDGRAMWYVEAFINGADWKDEVGRLDRLAGITKDDVVAWANEKLRPESYAVVYKRRGEDTSVQKIDKPSITPIATNRDKASDFQQAVSRAEVKPIEPVFLDYTKDLSVGEMKQQIPVLYKQNTTNQLFSLYYVYDFGALTDPVMAVALEDYLPLLGTDTRSLAEIQAELYELACDFRISVGKSRIFLNINGLGDNMSRAVELVEEYLSQVKGDDAVLAELKKDLLKARSDAKLNQAANFSALRNYVFFGPEAVKAGTLSDEQLLALTSDELVARIKGLNGYAHRVMYYGPDGEREFIEELNEVHRVASEQVSPERRQFPYRTVEEPSVVIAPYDAKQIYYMQYSNRNEPFSPDNDALVSLYDNYFSGGMNSVVFQEMREARGLAYTAYAWLSEGRDANDPYIYYAFIATQNDKMVQAVEAFEDIIENMPESETAFELAKQSILANLSTQRTIKDDVLWSYVKAQDMGVDTDRSKALYEKVRSLTLDDVKKFQQEWIKGRKYVYSILGDEKDLDMKFLESLGPVKRVSREEIFGY